MTESEKLREFRLITIVVAVFVFVLLFLRGLASAQTPNEAYQRGQLATARLLGYAPGFQSPASCVIVGYADGRAWAVACAHQAREERSWEIWPVDHTKSYPAMLVYKTPYDQSQEWSADVAVFTFRPAKPVVTAVLADSSPPSGDEVSIRGYPLGTPRLTGKIRQVSLVDGDCLMINGFTQPGDSGGSVLSRSTGRLVGILSSTDTRTSIATDVMTVRSVLSECAGYT